MGTASLGGGFVRQNSLCFGQPNRLQSKVLPERTPLLYPSLQPASRAVLGLKTHTNRRSQQSHALCGMVSRAVIIWLSMFGGSLTLCADEAEFFERKIRPVLVEHCYECHAGEADDIMGGLRLDDPGAMLRGGDSGVAVMPGKPDKSLLLTAIRYDGIEMPPSGKLDERIIADFETWITKGAEDPRNALDLESLQPSEIDWDVAKSFWAFQPPTTHRPSAALDNWGNGRIDSFVLAQLQAAGVAPNPPAEKATLLRRMSFDLTGLPPTIEQLHGFLADDRPGATRRMVDQLLASPANAERWTRLWLDVARFAEDQAHKVGNNDSLTYPNAYLYRDWVVDAFASDLPYDQFVRKQLAADLIDASDDASQIALGFLGLGPKYYRRNSPEVMADEWEDRIDTVSRGLLGLTVACARCHDHKFDPIPTSDYYALAGVFASTEMFNRPLDDSVEKKGDQAKSPKDATHVVRDGKPRDLNVYIRGDVKKLGPVVERRFLTALSESDPAKLTAGSGRLELADAIVDRSNPLAARVIVNRVWGELTGQPLVATPSNFGALGERPSHPKLLDDLSVRFMENGWSLKWLQREIVLSQTYQQSSEIDPRKSELDPSNTLFWRMPRRRMSVEAYRDAVLASTGRLDRNLGGKSIQPDDPKASKRTLYASVSRLDLNPMLARFDFPDPNAHSAMRFETTTPLQKLFLLNSPFLSENARRLAERLDGFGGSQHSKIEHAYQVLFARKPSQHEYALAEEFLAGGDSQAWQHYAQALLISSEMFIID